jgi:hypothetical protein
MISRTVLDEESETHPRDIEQGLLPVLFLIIPKVSLARRLYARKGGLNKCPKVDPCATVQQIKKT